MKFSNLFCFILFCLLIFTNISYSYDKSVGSFSYASVQVYLYSDQTDDGFTLRMSNLDSAVNGAVKHYAGTTNRLDSTVCRINLGSKINANFATSNYFTSDFKIFLTGAFYDLSHMLTTDILEMNYNMKTELKYIVEDPNGNIITGPLATDPQNNFTQIEIDPITNEPFFRIPFEGIDMPVNPFSYQDIEDYAIKNNLFGDYKIYLVANPIDLKCDFNSNGILDVGTETQETKTLISTVNVPPLVPTLTLNGPDYVLNNGDFVTFTWSATDEAISCKFDGITIGGGSNPNAFKLGGSTKSFPSGVLSYNYIYECTNSLNQVFSKNKTVYLDTDGDTVPDLTDECKTRPWNVGSSSANSPGQYAGCPYRFTIVEGTSCSVFSEASQSISCTFDNGKVIGIKMGDCDKYLYNGNTLVENTGSNTLFLSSYNKGSGFYSCQERDKWYCDNGSVNLVGSCQIQDNVQIFCQNTPDGTILEEGDKKVYYPTKYVKSDNGKFKCADFKEERICTSAGTLTGSSTNKYPTCIDLPEDYNSFDLIQDENGNYIAEEQDSYTINKMRADITNNQLLFIDANNTAQNVTLSETKDEDYKIIIIKDGVNIRNDTIDPVLIGLKAHKIRKFSSADEAVSFIDKSANIMKQFQITKNLTYKDVTNKTQVNIKLSGIPETARSNLTIYQVIDKSDAPTLSDVKFISDGGGERIIVDKDPVIGWYFNEITGDGEISYELSGNGTEGGTIIITQEPVLYNEGNLTINYRETSEGGCNVDEVALFEIDSLENTNVFPVSGNHLYQVCLSHVDSTVIIYNDTSAQSDLHLFNQSSGGNLSLYNAFNTISHDVSVNQVLAETMYWDILIQSDNPDGTYSCLGSIGSDINNSKFGDCGWNNNRIWLHLGEDLRAPVTSIYLPYLSHSVSVSVIANDELGGSGVNQTYYCVDSDNTCTPGVSGEVFGDGQDTFTLACPSDWGCLKYIRMYSIDNEGNIEDLVEQTIRLVDKGSSCQSDCTAKPAPNRYLKECRNLNGCFYHDINGDEGETVSKLCDFLSIGSWVKINSTHEVMCPNGQTRELKFSEDTIDLSLTYCDDVIAIPYTTVFEGETVLMKILTCQDEYIRN